MNLLFEIGTEELPAAYVSQASSDLRRMAAERISKARLTFADIESFATPRRLTLIVKGLPPASESYLEERRGPPAQAAFRDGEPTKAASGFARKAGVEVADLIVRDGYVWAAIEHPGEASAKLLPPILAGLIRDLPASKKMIWGNGEGPFVRPLRWLVALLDEEVLPLEVFNVGAGNTSRGHRFLAPQEVRVSPEGYRDQLYDAFVVADPSQRRERVALEADTLALSEGYRAELPADLLEEVTNLLEWPLAILGSFSEKYLELPDEVLATVMIKHQRFFPVSVSGGKLVNKFIGVSGHQPKDLGIVRKGYEQVLEGRLYDALFFWREDLKTPLPQHHQKLSGINFQHKLGTMADKVSRIARAASSLAAPVSADAKLLQQASALFKSDLGTQMVYEFPELEGVMARAYALKQGYPAEVAAALQDSVLPAAGASALPQSREGALLAALDRCDTLVGFFQIGKRPSGSADPYGLRRAAVGLLRILGSQGWRLPARSFLEAAADSYRDWGLPVGEETVNSVESYLNERLESLLAEAGLPTLAIRAANTQGSVYDRMLRAVLIYSLMQKPEFAELTRLYKRAANLAEQSQSAAEPESGLFERDEEKRLYEALPAVGEALASLLREGAELLPPWDPAAVPPSADLTALEPALQQILRLAESLDPFMDNVLVMVEDSHIRENRLALLRRVRDSLAALGALEVLGG